MCKFEFFYIVQILEIQFSWFFLKVNNIVFLCPLEPLPKLFEPIFSSIQIQMRIWVFSL
jgi:hypothetical protein